MRPWYVISSDLNGNRCRDDRVYVPSEIADPERALHYIRNSTRLGPYGQFFPYATATEVERG